MEPVRLALKVLVATRCKDDQCISVISSTFPRKSSLIRVTQNVQRYSGRIHLTSEGLVFQRMGHNEHRAIRDEKRAAAKALEENPAWRQVDQYLRGEENHEYVRLERSKSQASKNHGQNKVIRIKLLRLSSRGGKTVNKIRRPKRHNHKERFTVC